MQITAIDDAGRVYDRSTVARYAAGAMLAGLILFFGGALIQEVDARYPVPVFLSFLGEQLPWAGFVCIVAWGVFRPASLAGRIGIVGLMGAALYWIFDAAARLWMVRDAGLLWAVSGVARLAVMTWISLEVIWAAWALLTAKLETRRLVQEPKTIHAIFGLPPALAFLTTGRRLIAAQFALPAVCFSLAIQQTTGLSTSAQVVWDAAVEACGKVSDIAAQRACLADHGWGDVFGQFVVWPATFVVAIWLGRWIQQRARKAAHDRAAAVMRGMREHRDFRPILFLRTFEDDQVELPDPSLTALARLFGQVRNKPPLDHLLVEEFALYGPAIALAKVVENKHLIPDHGVWRFATEHENWQDLVTEFAAKATAIVMVTNDAPKEGVAWELQHLAEARHLGKTIYLCSPKCAQAASNSAVWTTIARFNNQVPGFADAVGTGAVLAAFKARDGQLNVATSQRFSRSDYHMALRQFFRQLNP